MKLLLDQNLSPRLCEPLSELAETVLHVRQVGLAEADDEVVRAYAADHGLAVVTKDGDFNSLAFLHGAPPKIIWLRLGNCSTSDIERILRSNRSALEHFVDDPTASVLVLE